MKKFTGLSVCDGLVVCRLVCIPENVVRTAPAYAITAQNIQQEQERLRVAVQAAQDDLRKMLAEYQTVDIQTKSPEQAILETHQTMLAANTPPDWDKENPVPPELITSTPPI